MAVNNKKSKPPKRKYKLASKKQANGLPIEKQVYEISHLRIKKLIREIISSSDFKHCYIGATEDLDTRWSNYSNWKFKHVLYYTTSYKRAVKSEEDLIKYVTEKGISCNKDPESKGLQEGAAIYYIYILADKICKLRN